MVFSSPAAGLTAGDNPLLADIFLRDVRAGTTELESVSSNGLPTIAVPNVPYDGGSMGSFLPDVSADGRRVVFTSNAINLVDGDTNSTYDVFVRDRSTGQTRRVSVTSDGKEGDGRSIDPVISANGRYVAFTSDATDLVPDDTNEASDVFVHDMKTRKTVRVSVSPKGAQAANSGSSRPASYMPSINADGRYVVFTSGADNLVADDENQASDVFVHDVKTGRNEIASVASGQTSSASDLVSPGGDNFPHSISADGRFVVFHSSASVLVPNDSGAGGSDRDVFVHDRKTGRTQRISVASSGEELYEGAVPLTYAESHYPAISPDGRYVAFYSYVFGPDSDGKAFVRIHDWATGATEVVRQVDAPLQVIGVVKNVAVEIEPCLDPSQPAGSNPSVSVGRAGRFVSFDSCSGALVEADSNNEWDTFVHDRGFALGVGGSEAHPSQEPSDDSICIQPDVCIPPGGTATARDGLADVTGALTEQGANLYGASLTYRPQYDDLFAAIELDHMPHVLPGPSPLFYGLRFTVEDKSYEVRATSLLGGTFGLFDCTDPTPVCTKVADLHGGYGTTGMRVVFSLPLSEIGLQHRGALTDVGAFSAFGTFLSGAAQTLDQVELSTTRVMNQPR